MSNKSGKNSLESKLIKKLTPSKPSSGTNSIYSGVSSAQRALKNPTSAHSGRSNQSKRLGDRVVTFETENLPPPVEYHSWKLEYHQIYTREITKRSMTKDSYTPTIRSFAYAEERITTQEECCPVLIPANSVHIEKAEIHEAIKVLTPTVVRYVRGSDILPSERSGSRTLVNKSSVSQIQFETKAPIPVIGSNQINGSVPTLTLNDRLLNRPTMHVDASIIRRPPRRLIRNVTHENIVRLAVYG